MIQLHTEVTGSGDDLLLLLHGMGATGAIWSPFIAARPAHWPGRIAALDLPGHGASGTLGSYAMPAVAASLAIALAPLLPVAGNLRLLGHSYGGVVALHLAGLMAAGPPEHVYGLGIKSVWAEDELAGMHRLAQKPQKLYPDAESARQWYLKVAGIAGMAPTGMDCGARAIVEAPAGQWRLAQDPRVYDIASPDLPSLTANLQGRFSLGYGAEDSMVDVADLARIDPAVARLEGGGHNIMVNRPEAVWAWLS